ncbi:hypothetical protein HRbin17_01591 [bacterium HR17]|uniref:Thioredoxin-like fold domain-containing protein n=1 Tax=Candidatus Fervidibacter japonicus TaxID=2035412 RepID=A0A2H5XD11_9BACT|nr:hypothetical protein HRbin17_01591 [bacterium HR17]
MRLDAAVYPDPEVAHAITQTFVPVKLNILEDADAQQVAQQYHVRWTPTLLVADGDGVEQLRFEGFIGKERLLGKLVLVQGFAAFHRSDFASAAQRFEEAAQRYPSVAAEALFWLGVARYKGGDLEGLKAAWTQVWNNYPDTEWAERVSFLFTS